MGKRMFDAGEQAWAEEAPFHTPVFAVTHTKRDPWERPGGTTFHFVNDGISSALGLVSSKCGRSLEIHRPHKKNSKLYSASASKYLQAKMSSRYAASTIRWIFSGAKNSGTGTVPVMVPMKRSASILLPRKAAKSCCICGGGGSRRAN